MLKSTMICQSSWQSFCTHQLELKAYYDQIAHLKKVKCLSFSFTVGLYLFFGLTLFDVMDAMTGVSFASFFITYITYNNINTASTYICTSGTSILAFWSSQRDMRNEISSILQNTGYGGYGATETGYGAPSSGYGAPSSGYSAPSSGYNSRTDLVCSTSFPWHVWYVYRGSVRLSWPLNRRPCTRS